eukprot:gnl/TRDRNA2_/TRDRNA2_86580_c1_seq2.p1 gnl/TRDRNA2_/TRDRNA2_86580_c1~~gnl/TRDRNA2_/TRDRNA2_86580_c1_seq2.p1  ORF type:complete len:323 (+),score=70.53 gnl/TRDRNA2_/TRDRNA2_86580_c1_seq2:89-1057(+)
MENIGQLAMATLGISSNKARLLLLEVCAVQALKIGLDNFSPVALQKLARMCGVQRCTPEALADALVHLVGGQNKTVASQDTVVSKGEISKAALSSNQVAQKVNQQSYLAALFDMEGIPQYSSDYQEQFQSCDGEEKAHDKEEDIADATLRDLSSAISGALLKHPRFDTALQPDMQDADVYSSEAILPAEDDLDQKSDGQSGTGSREAWGGFYWPGRGRRPSKDDTAMESTAITTTSDLCLQRPTLLEKVATQQLMHRSAAATDDIFSYEMAQKAMASSSFWLSDAAPVCDDKLFPMKISSLSCMGGEGKISFAGVSGKKAID